VIPPLISGIVPWLLPPLCGALVGCVLGFFVLGRFILSRLSRHKSAVVRAASDGIESLTRWGLALHVGDLLPSRGSPAAITLERGIAEILRGILGSRSVIYGVRAIVSRVVTGVCSRKMHDVFREAGLSAFLSERLLPAIGSERSRLAIASAAGTLVSEQAGAALEDGVLREVSGVFESYVPEAADAIVRWLRSGETRAYLSERGRELLPRILEKLNDLQKLFISAGQFDRRLNEKMPEIVDDTIAAAERMVRDPLQQERIVSQFFQSARGWRDSLLATPAGSSRPGEDARGKLADSASSLLSRFLERLEDPSVRQSIAALLEKDLFQDRRTVGAFISDVFRIPDTEIAEVLSARALGFLMRPETAQEIAGAACGMLFSLAEENAQARVGDMLRIDEQKKRAFDQALRARAPRVVESLLPVITKEISAHIRLGRLSAAVGTGLGLAVGAALTLLRFLGFP
jgi:hypothetical protein